MPTYRRPFAVRTRTASTNATAHFGCRNQRKPKEPGGLFQCGSDDQLDYRSAWETDQRPATPGRGQIRCNGTSYPLSTGGTLFDYADQLGTRVPTSCERTGHCHECIVEVSSGAQALSAPTPAEEFLGGEFRLACQAKVEDADVDIEFAPAFSPAPHTDPHRGPPRPRSTP